MKYTGTTWRFGTTTFNRANLLQELIEMIKITDSFWKQNNSSEWDNENQERWFNYAFNWRTPIFGTNQSKENKSKLARQYTAAMLNYNLCDENRKLTTYGVQLICNKKNENIIKLAKKYCLSVENIIILRALINNDWKEKENSESKFNINPPKILLEYFSEYKNEIPLDNILWTMKAENINELKDFLDSGIENYKIENVSPYDLSEEIIQPKYFHNNNGKNKNLYIKEFYNYCMQKYLQKENQVQEINWKSSNFKKLKKINEIFEEENFKILNLEQLNSLFIISYLKTQGYKKLKDYEYQLKSGLILMGVFKFSKIAKNLYVSLRDNIDANFLKLICMQENELGKYFEINPLKPLSNFASEKEKNIKTVYEIMENYNIFEYLENDELYLIKDLPQEIVNQKTFVNLEYFVGLKLAKLFSQDLETIFSKNSLDENGLPISHTPGKVADFELDNYVFEVTYSNGEISEKLEIEPVTRHLAKHMKKNDKNSSICFFVGKDPISINFLYDSLMKREYKYFFLSKKNTEYIAEKFIIIPLTIKQFSNFQIHNIEELVNYHKNYSIENKFNNTLVKKLIAYTEGIDEILNKK